MRNVNGATTRWSNLREATFNVAGALAALKLTEIHYKPLVTAPFEFELGADEVVFAGRPRPFLVGGELDV